MVSNMLSETKLKELARKLTGREDPAEALEETLRGYVEQKLEHYRQEISQLEEKHDVKFEVFAQRLGKDMPLSWEHEQDYMVWEEALTNLKYFRNVRRQLKVHA